MESQRVPDRLAYVTADTVAECLEYGQYLSKEESLDLYRKLWGFVAAAENPTPLGGDGSGGTAETPCGRLQNNDDKAPHWWHLLTAKEQNAIMLCL